MSFNFTAGNPRAHRIRVYYEGSQTIQEGMPLCYNSDTTTNWFGGSQTAGTITATTTTAEGSQNEGKWIRVEDPASTNLPFFAGVVAAGSKKIGTTGPSIVDIFVPNGAIVPVRSSLSSTVNVTIFAIRPAVYTLTNPVYGGSTTSLRSVGLAMETVDRSSTNGLCLCKLDPNMFMIQGYGVSANYLDPGVGVTTGTVRPNNISLRTSQTGGAMQAWRIRSEANGAGSAVGGVQFDTILSNTSQSGTSEVASFQFTWKSGATASAFANYVAEFKYENQDGTPADLQSGTLHANLRLVSNISSTTPPAANTVYWMTCNAEGADKPDGLLFVDGLTDVGGYVSTGDAPALATGDVMIPVRLAGTTYYLVALADTGV